MDNNPVSISRRTSGRESKRRGLEYELTIKWLLEITSVVLADRSEIQEFNLTNPFFIVNAGLFGAVKRDCKIFSTGDVVILSLRRIQSVVDHCHKRSNRAPAPAC